GRLIETEPPSRPQPVADALVAALDRASEGEEKLVLAALPRVAEAAVAPLGRLLGDGKQPEAERTHAARALGVLAEAGKGMAPARAALLAAAGEGPLPLRVMV